MKKLFLILIISFVIHITNYSQTYQAEYNFLHDKYVSGNFGERYFQKKIVILKENIDKYGYAEIPYDSLKKEYRYQFVFRFDSINKTIIYNRVLEYLTLKYGSLYPIIDYQDFDMGKIIVSIEDTGKSTVSNKPTKYFCRYRFTVTDHKINIETFDIQYFNVIEFTKINIIYPITDSESNYWREKLKITRNIDDDIKNTNYKIFQFIKDYQKDYEF